MKYVRRHPKSELTFGENQEFVLQRSCSKVEVPKVEVPKVVPEIVPEVVT